MVGFCPGAVIGRFVAVVWYVCFVHERRVVVELVIHHKSSIYEFMPWFISSFL